MDAGRTSYSKPLFRWVSRKFDINGNNTIFHENRAQIPQIYFVLSNKEKEEIDFLIQLPNNQYISIEVKVTPMDMNTYQLRLLASLNLNIIDRWIVSFTRSGDFRNARVVCLDALFKNLATVV
ncbi:hypothetical protein [Candidatus Coxiella mudrowiae]|uniref:hypothetical protein n=1 Tax=Candidatus Coxiella mudrowiae TaxID=2054173 RepID=UPI000C287E2E|nr:hypothetical protein [Candidatus Coxiella mudrowiae]